MKHLILSRAAKTIAGIFFGSLIAIGFQDCNGKGFTTGSTDLSSSGAQGSSTTNPTPTYLGIHNTDFQTCYAANPTSAAALATCFTTYAPGLTFTAQAVSTCMTAGNTSPLYLAICLSNAGFIVFETRSPKQSDIDKCNTAVGPTNIAACLTKHGVDVGATAGTSVTQDQINQCLTLVGESSIEKCLHKNAFIPTQAIVMQSDANLCELVAGGTSTLAACLSNADLLPATVAQTDIDTCVTTAGPAAVIRCLRVGHLVPNVLMQWHINTCNTAVGSAAIATCLDKNGVLPIDPTSTLTSAQIATYVQNDINACVTAVGETAVAQCLRKRGIISNEVMQPHIDSCFAVAGVNAYNCLAANFAVLPTTLTTTALQTCFTNNAGTSTNAAECLASQGILPTTPFQTHISSCARFAGLTNIATCLMASDLLPAGVVEADIDTCVAAVGLANVAVCLNNKGFVPSYQAMLAPTGVFGANCVTCHNATTASGTVNLSSYATIIAAKAIVPGNDATSVMYNFVNNGTMPKNAPKLSAALIATIGLWITQGANDDVDVPPTASALLATGTIMGNLTAGGGNAAAFDGTTAKLAAKSAEAAAVGGYIGKTFTAATTVTKWSIWGSTDLCYNNPVTNGATVLDLQYSDDGTTYTTVDSITTTATCAGPEVINRNLPGPNMAHMYWRVMQGAGSKGNLIVGQLEFFGY